VSDPEDEPRGSLRPTSGRALAISAVVGLAFGWGLHPLGRAATGEAPRVSWLQPLALALVAAILAFLAWHTWRTVQVQGHRLDPQHAVNRLVLARACALVGALVAAAYVGFAVGWLGDASVLADRWTTRSLVAAAAAAGVMGASLALESACRTPPADGDP
jgi:hypothetical protein